MSRGISTGTFTNIGIDVALQVGKLSGEILARVLPEGVKL